MVPPRGGNALHPLMKYPLFMLWLPAMLLAPAALHAAHPLTTDDTGTQGRGNFQLELTTEHAYEEENGTRETTVRLNAALAYGLRDNLDVVLSVPTRRISSQAEDGSRTVNQGRADIGLDVKWRFYEKNGLSFALKGGVTSPTGDETKNLGTGKSTHNANLITSYESAPWEFHLHLGYVRNRNTLEQREDLYHASIAAGRRMGEGLKVVADYGTDSNTSKTNDMKPEFFILGLIYNVRKSMDIDFGAKWGLTPPETDFTWLGGVAFRF